MNKVYINPGHDSSYGVYGTMIDCGAVNEQYGLTEAEVVKTIGELVEEYLEDAGCIVRINQCDNLAGEPPYQFQYTHSVCADANYWDADLFVSIHCNAFNGSAKGTECFFGGAESGIAAECIQKQLVDTLHTIDRGTKFSDSLCVIKNTTMPAVLVEVCFIDNADDVKLLLDADYVNEISKAIARGITDYFVAVGGVDD